MKFTTKDLLFAKFATGPVIHEVALPDGDTGFVRVMSAHERTQFDISIDKKQGGVDRVRELLVTLCACDDLGNRIFDDTDVTKVGLMPVTVTEPYFEKARVVNGMVTVSAEDTKKN